MIEKFQKFLASIVTGTEVITAKEAANIYEAADALYGEINPPLYHPGDAMYILVIYTPAGNTSTTGVYRVFIHEVKETINALEADQAALRYAKEAAGRHVNNIVMALHLPESVYQNHWYKRNYLPEVL